eukprot:NODE_197_length_15379_cov_0.485602.p6 type:complete len:359 gc:universal NODE_197_length_15379_cov_0.485602:8339-7263(-)
MFYPALMFGIALKTGGKNGNVSDSFDILNKMNLALKDVEFGAMIFQNENCRKSVVKVIEFISNTTNVEKRLYSTEFQVDFHEKNYKSIYSYALQKQNEIKEMLSLCFTDITPMINNSTEKSKPVLFRLQKILISRFLYKYTSDLRFSEHVNEIVIYGSYFNALIYELDSKFDVSDDFADKLDSPDCQAAILQQLQKYCYYNISSLNFLSVESFMNITAETDFLGRIQNLTIQEGKEIADSLYTCNFKHFNTFHFGFENNFENSTEGQTKRLMYAALSGLKVFGPVSNNSNVDVAEFDEIGDITVGNATDIGTNVTNFTLLGLANRTIISKENDNSTIDVALTPSTDDIVGIDEVQVRQ